MAVTKREAGTVRPSSYLATDQEVHVVEQMAVAD